MAREINMLGSLSSPGGGEQSLCTIANAMRHVGWKVYLYPWDTVAAKHKDTDILRDRSFVSGNMAKYMKPNLPLFFYGNDQIYSFTESGDIAGIMQKTSKLVIGINFTFGSLYKANWLKDKLRLVLFLNTEKQQDFIHRRCRDLRSVATAVYAPPVDMSVILPGNLCRKETDPFVVLRHSRGDARKFFVGKCVKGGDAVHLWQQHLYRMPDIELYTKLLKAFPLIRFQFMSAPTDLSRAFKDGTRMQFRPFDSMPVADYLRQGHAYLYRVSDYIREQGPRTIVEAQAAGLPVICEHRDGPIDRIVHGNTGFYALDYEDIEHSIARLYYNEKYRKDMSLAARLRAMDIGSPEAWAKVIGEAVR